MDQNRLSGFGAVSRGRSSLADVVSRNRLNGLAAIIIGLSQLPLAFMVADSTGYEISLFVIGAGGWLLVGIGVNVFRGMEAFEFDWSESNRVAWVSTIVTCLFATVVATAAFLIVT